MSGLQVTLFKAGKPETTVTLPSKILKSAPKLLPKQAIELLKEEGIDLEELIALAAKPEAGGGVLVEVEQHTKNVKLSVTKI